MSDGHATATLQRDLRTGTPVWLRRGGVRVASTSLAANLKVDVVGAGG